MRKDEVLHLNTFITVIILGIWSVTAGCSDDPSTDESNSHGGADADKDKDGNGSGDTGGDGEADADATSDKGGDTDADGDSDGDADVDTDADSDVDGDTDADNDADADADSDVDGDADADNDADADGDADKETDTGDDTHTGGDTGDTAVGDCQPGDPITVSVLGCGMSTSDKLVTCDEVVGCSGDNDCTTVNFDKCCQMQAVAVLKTALQQVSDRIPTCKDFVMCPMCAVPLYGAVCVENECTLDLGSNHSFSASQGKRP